MKYLPYPVHISQPLLPGGVSEGLGRVGENSSREKKIPLTHLRAILHKVGKRRVRLPLDIQLHRVQRLGVLDKFIVVHKLPLWQQVVERLREIALATKPHPSQLLVQPSRSLAQSIAPEEE